MTVTDHKRSWTGLSDKTLWDWLELLIVPAVLAAAALLLNQCQSEREVAANEAQERRAQRLAHDQQREQQLHGYINAMTSLIFDRGLVTSSRKDDVRTVGTTLTLATLKRLDGERRGVVLQFLYDTGLIFREDSYPVPEKRCRSRPPDPCWGSETIIDLVGADLRDAELYYAELKHADLSGVDFRGANLEGAHMVNADLQASRFDGANMASANLEGSLSVLATFVGTDLRDAFLVDSFAYCTQFVQANLSGAHLRKTYLAGANLFRANLTDVELTGAYLEKAMINRAKLDGVEGKGALSEVWKRSYDHWQDNFLCP